MEIRPTKTRRIQQLATHAVGWSLVALGGFLAFVPGPSAPLLLLGALALLSRPMARA